MMKTLTRFALAVLAAVLLFACTRPESETAPNRRVVLMYAAAYSNLSPSIAEDIRELCGGAIPAVGSGDVLLVYSHHTKYGRDYSTPTNPVLFRAYIDMDGKQRRDTITVYPETDVSSSAEVFHKVLCEVQDLFPAQSYGLVFSSHARGWLPVDYEEPSSSYFNFFAPRRFPGLRVSENLLETKWLGIENAEGSGIDIRDLADAIPMKLDFFLLDACLMGCVEVAYELREKCNYVAFSPTEILSNGFMYDSMASRLLNVQSPDLKQICQDYYEYYNSLTGNYRSATITLVNCRKTAALAEACASIISAHRDGLAAADRNNVQAYFYNELHWFYDLRDLLEKAGATPEELARLDSALSECVVYAAATPTFFNLKLDNVCGLSMYFPYPEKKELNNYYKTLSWNKATGLIQ